MLEAMSLGTPAKSLSTTLDNTTLSVTAECEKSPILFDSEEENDEAESFTDTTSSKTDDSFKFEVDIRDEKYVHKLKTTLAGVPPPPKFTIPQFSAAEMLDIYNKNVEKSTSYLQCVERTEDKVINEEMKALQFPDAMQCLYYGIHYNRGAHSVEYEFLSNKYQERYVGSETSCTVIDKTSSLQDSLTASAKKKARKHPWNYSPGRRLSHLARRRQIFTSASLPRARAVTGNRTKANVMDSRRMILLDNRKSSSQSSARSRLASLSLSSQPSTSTQMPKLQPQPSLTSSSSYSQMPSLKRALFQSPDCFSREASRPSQPEKETPRTDRNKARRALFSSGSKKERTTPNKKTPCKKTPNKKTPNKQTPRQGGRKTPHKGTPTSSRKKTPRKSLFSDTDDGNRLSSRDLFNVNGKRPRSESQLNLHAASSTVTLSSDEKKKLLWVVYHCLKERKINTKNSLYRPCQNSLYRLCSNEWRAQLAEQPEGTRITNVSEKLLNIARKHVSGVILKVKNNQSFYRSSVVPKDNSSESGDTSLTSLSHPDASKLNLEPSDYKSTGRESACDDRSDVESIAKSDFDKESICVRSDIDSTYARSECSSSIKRASSSSCLQDEESNTVDSAIFMPDSLMSDTNTSSSIPIRQDSNSTVDSSVRTTRSSKRNSNSKDTTDVSKESMLELEVVENSAVVMETSDSSLVENKTDCSVPGQSVFTSPFMRQVKNSSERSLLNSMSSDVRKVLEINGVPNTRRMLGDINNIPNEAKLPIGDISSVYDEETRF